MSLLIAIDLRPLIEPFESGVTVFTKEMVAQFQGAKFQCAKRDCKRHSGKFVGGKGERVELILFYQSRQPCERIHKLFPEARHIKVSTTWHRLRSLFGFPNLPKGYFGEGLKRQPDLIFMPDRRPFYKTNIPVVLMVHDLVPEKFARTLSLKGRVWFKIFSLKRLLKIADGVLTPTLFVANELKAYLPKIMRKVRREVVYEGANLADHAVMPSDANRLAKKPFFFTLSPADPRKRISWVIKMAVRFPRVNFAIVGIKKGDKRFSGACLERSKKLKNFFIFGQVSEQEKLWFFKNAIALLALSKYEGFDLPVLEAVVTKCPVIMSDIPVHAELYKDATFVRNESALQVAIYNLLQSCGGKSGLAQNGRAQSGGVRKLHVPVPRGEYTWEAAARRALLFFCRVVADKNR